MPGYIDFNAGFEYADGRHQLFVGFHNRRRNMRHYLKTFALVAVLVLIVAACAGDDADETDGMTGPSGTEAPDTGGVVTHAAGSTADVYIPQYRAAELFGDLFGLSTEDHLTAFEEGSLAAQVVVAGQIDVASGGFTPVVQVIE